MKFENKNSLVPKMTQLKLQNKLFNYIDLIKTELKKEYFTEYAALNLPEDQVFIKHVQKLAKQYKGHVIIVIGIGGSNLGTKAVHDAICGQFAHQILFVDTVDTNLLVTIKSLKLKKVVYNIISKSGTTTETIANFLTLNPKENIVITTNRNSLLWDYGIKKGYELLEIPQLVGGRYSVFSYVGLFPLAAAGININQLLEGAKDAKKSGLQKRSNSAINSAIDLFHHYTKKINISENIFFSPELESLGKWYRQLMGESVGKKFNLKNQTVWNGMTPTVAIGSTDLHSIAQLYLGGPKDKFITITEPVYKRQLKVPKSTFPILKEIQGKSLSEIMVNIIKGVEGALEKQNRPYNKIYLNVNDEYDLGYYLQTKMLEIIYLAHLMNVNPFDQPNVEDYKIITKKLLQK